VATDRPEGTAYTSERSVASINCFLGHGSVLRIPPTAEDCVRIGQVGKRHLQAPLEIGQVGAAQGSSITSTSQKLDSWEGGKRKIRHLPLLVPSAPPLVQFRVLTSPQKLEQLLGSLQRVSYGPAGARSVLVARGAFIFRLPPSQLVLFHEVHCPMLALPTCNHLRPTPIESSALFELDKTPKALIQMLDVISGRWYFTDRSVGIPRL
jgi:hypothetical protein